ncbi:hypothetical protein FHW89_004381 [Mucilaginibacter sp. SG564]|nr:hypothetical protein [Mucilaginibacter sp. SG564]
MKSVNRVNPLLLAALLTRHCEVRSNLYTIQSGSAYRDCFVPRNDTCIKKHRSVNGLHAEI